LPEKTLAEQEVNCTGSHVQSALQHSRIVPDVIDGVDVDHEVEMAVRYPTGFAVANGNDIPKNEASHCHNQ
jgi:hypothetical protein